MNWSQWKNTFQSPKSTITGLCGAAIAIILAIIALPPKASVPVIALAVLRALIDFTKQDAGQTPATLPGSAQTQMVPSHEMPDDPEATPILPKT